jgi:hypothetical protein
MTSIEAEDKRADPRFVAAFAQEEARLQREYPTTEDVPGCMGLFDTFLLCNDVPLLLARSPGSQLREHVQS